MHPQNAPPENTPHKEPTCNPLRPQGFEPHYPLRQKKVISSLDKAKAALEALERALPHLGVDVARVALYRAHRRIRALQSALRPARTHQGDHNVWRTTLHAQDVRHARVAPLPDLPASILALFPRVEPVYLTQTEDR